MRDLETMGDAPMNITFLYKWGRDVEDAYVRDDASIKWRLDKLVPSDDDAAAIAGVRNVAAVDGNQVTGVTIGNGDVPWAIARGVEKVACADALVPDDDEGRMAEMLAAAVRAAGDYDLVVMGDEQDSAGVAALLAAKLGLPLVAGVNDLAASENEGEVVAHRTTGKSIDELRIKAPALVTVAAVDSEKETPSIKQMLAAKKKPVEKLEVEAPAPAKTTVDAVRLPEVHRAKIFEGDTSEAVGDLVAALRADGVL